MHTLESNIYYVRLNLPLVLDKTPVLIFSVSGNVSKFIRSFVFLRITRENINDICTGIVTTMKQFPYIFLLCLIVIHVAVQARRCPVHHFFSRGRCVPTNKSQAIKEGSHIAKGPCRSGYILINGICTELTTLNSF